MFMIINRFDFTTDVLSRIQSFIDGKPNLSRVKLSRAVCGMFNWKSVTGKLKEMSCRVALLKLERAGKLRLPVAQPFRHVFTRPKLRVPLEKTKDEEEINCSLRALGLVQIVRIDSSDTKDSRRWNDIMSRHHYLGAGPLCGAQIRYLIRDAIGRVLGGFAFSASALSVASRDRWIGWTAEAKKENLQRVVCNSRFLVLPHVRVAHLASHVLGLISRRIADDWHDRYGYKPVLLETYVDRRRFKGTSYRAANWIHAGATTGRSRQDRDHTLYVGEKDIFVLELCKKARELLCMQKGIRVNDEPVVLKIEPQDWAEEEFGGAKLGDRRLEQRLLTIARDFWANPQANIPQACRDRAKAKAAYRFFEHEKVVMEEILKPHYEATIQRIRKEKVILAVQDTTELNYATHPMTEGLGPVGTNRDGAVGLFVHDTLAITPEGTPLGLLDVQCWARNAEDFGKRRYRHELPIEAKESNKWLQSFRCAEHVQSRCKDTMVVSVGDRESDIYELFVKARDNKGGPHVLVRARQDRMLAEGHGELWEMVKGTMASGETEVTIPRRGNRAARRATLEVRFIKAVLSPPKRKKWLGEVTLWAVAAQEINAPENIEPIEWLLLTTMEVATFESALEMLLWYSRRWGIEVYHRTLKSGCKIEDRQLGAADRIEACLAIDMVVAWRIYYLIKMGRETPDVPCTVFFEDYEWKALVTHIHKKSVHQQKPPSLRNAVRMVASLGGFMGRKSDGEPGTKTTWLGLQCLDGISIMFKYMAETYAPHLLTPSVSVNPTYG